MGVEIDPQLVENLKEKRFPTVKHGCDPEQVDAFLVTVASSIESLPHSSRRPRLPRRVRPMLARDGWSGWVR